jgi:hypothetical protein
MMKQIHPSAFLLLPADRRGLSIMEVLFAIGVLTVGLLGIASILPVATTNASKTLQRDKGIEEVNNTVAAEVARIGEQMDSVILANSTAASHPVVSRFLEIPLASLPNAICIDPWFLTAADNLRPGDGSAASMSLRNGYDRTQFPCYDSRFDPMLSPSQQLSDSGTPVAPAFSPSPDIWFTPRFTRVAVPFDGSTSAPSFKAMQSGAREVDNLSLFQPKDTTFPPGLFVQKASTSRALSKNNVSGRYSSMAMLSRSAPGSNIYQAAIVTMLDREVVIVRGGGAQAFQLAPYTAAAPDKFNPADDELTYADEVIGFVTFAPRPFIGGGGGEFVFRHSAFMSPKVRAGDWLMLARQEYAVRNIPPSTPPLPSLAVKFAWYQVRSVVQSPLQIDLPPADDPEGDVFETRVSVRGPDWIFHPSQVNIAGLGYAPPYTEAAPRFGPDMGGFTANPPEYNVDNTADRRFGTIVVLMPKVVSVYQTQITL